MAWAQEAGKEGRYANAVHSHQGDGRCHPGLGPAAHRGQRFFGGRVGGLCAPRGDRTDLVVDDNAQEVEGVGVPPMRELLGKLREHEVPV
jgi:hypothetical protein